MSARSIGCTSLAYIDKEDFYDCIKRFPSDIE